LLGANSALFLPGTQPLIAVGAVATNVPTLMSQLALAGATIQNSLVSSTMCSNLPYNVGAVSHSLPSTDDTGIRGALNATPSRNT